MKFSRKADDFFVEIVEQRSLTVFFIPAALDESVKIVESLGGWCRGQIVDISKREEVYKAAAEIKNNFGEVSYSTRTITLELQCFIALAQLSDHLRKPR